MSKNDGGPAFPKPCDECSHAAGEHATYGMSLRDWFAGMALANDYVMASDSNDTTRTAKWAYALADAMLKVRARPGEPHAPPR